MRNKFFQPQCKTDYEPRDQDELEIISDVLSRPIAWHTPVQATEQQEFEPIIKIQGIVIGQLIDNEGIKVDYPSNPAQSPLFAISACTITEHDVGREAVLTFQNSDPYKPILLGFIEQPQKSQQHSNTTNKITSRTPIALKLNDEQLILSAEKEIVLKCGKSSITLTKAGKIILRGAYLLSRSTGVNQIKGGTVQIN
jgi:hypothetical protein